MAKSLDHLNPGGELIFITPRDFLKSTSAAKVNQMLYDTGSFTHYEELGDSKVFDGAAPNCAIWRWEKGRSGKRMDCGRTFCFSDGQIWFGEDGGSRLGDFFDVKVGAVSGADKIFAHPGGNAEFVCSQTRSTGMLRRMIYGTQHPSLLAHKETLMARKIRRFDESNWWEWGRKHCHRTGPRIYVNAKTRHSKPFFASEAEAYDGSVLALFPKRQSTLFSGGVHRAELEDVARRLNDTDWGSLGFVCDGRHIFSQRSLTYASVRL